MITQLDCNSRLSELLLKDSITNQDVVLFLKELDAHYVKYKSGDVCHRDAPYKSMRTKLTRGHELTREELRALIEILANVNKLFRTYGRVSRGLQEFVFCLKRKL